MKLHKRKGFILSVMALSILVLAGCGQSSGSSNSTKNSNAFLVLNLSAAL